VNEHRDLWWPSPAVEHAATLQLDLSTPFETQYGHRLDRIQTAYESWGQLNADGDNAILIVHPLASDPHAAGIHFGQADGWWDALVGPGLAIDTDRYFVVCPNLLGGCYGTTGPRFPADGAEGDPFLGEFPLLTPRDMQKAQRLFVEQLGIKRLARVVGPSMGAMVAWEWALAGEDFVEQVVAVAAPLRTTPYQIGLNWLQRRGIELDLTDDDLAAKAGQMIARGVGMLSYRSPVGLEEKFGRDWFQKPKGTLAKRGMYNIESWLRHHGKRIVKRFDPYTYILFSRAMDLHDVGEGRGGLVAALDEVKCDVVAVGISSDQLYPAADVRLGVDILHHLGKSAHYAEVRSPHGHDAFLLETDQLAEILGASATSRGGVSIGMKREVRNVRLGLLGAGRVASRLLRLLSSEGDRLRREHGLEFAVIAVAEIDTKKELGEEFAGVERTADPAALVAREDIDVVLDLTRGTGSQPWVKATLERGASVVTPNKSLVREHGVALERLALENGARLAYRNSIAAGWPLIYSVERPLGRERVHRIYALLSTTCNRILELIEGGRNFEEALALVKADGWAEPDPDLDVSGWDSLQKLIILIAHARRLRYDAEDIDVVGVRDVDPELVRQAPSFGFRIRYVALMEDLEKPGVEIAATVRPCAVPDQGHLGASGAENNVLVLDGERTGEMVFLGKGAGAMPVASAVLGDLVGLSDAEHSWTGRYPAAISQAIPPQFKRYLVIVDGQVTHLDVDQEGAVPVLDSLPVYRGDSN